MSGQITGSKFRAIENNPVYTGLTPAHQFAFFMQQPGAANRTDNGTCFLPGMIRRGR